MLAVAACTALAGCGGGSHRIQLQSVSEPGANAFTPSFVSVQPAHVMRQLAVQTGTRFTGSAPGLYGGTGDSSTCDAARLVSFLQAHPDKARAWAAVEGIPAARIPAYVRSLTPVLLRADTYVTNHGFVDGHATTYGAVLEAGTAVLVDAFGVPRVKCGCGNPLTEALTLPSSPAYTGTRWDGFDPAHIVLIKRAPAPVHVFTIVDVTTGRRLSRPAGSATSAQQQSHAAKARVGQPLLISAVNHALTTVNYRITLLRVSDPQPPDSAAWADLLGPGQRYVGVFLRVQNASAQPTTPPSSIVPTLATNRHQVVDAGTAADDGGECTDHNSITSGSAPTLAPGAAVSGCVTFTMDRGEQPLTLTMGNGSWAIR